MKWIYRKMLHCNIRLHWLNNLFANAKSQWSNLRRFPPRIRSDMFKQTDINHLKHHHSSSRWTTREIFTSGKRSLDFIRPVTLCLAPKRWRWPTGDHWYRIKIDCNYMISDRLWSAYYLPQRILPSNRLRGAPNLAGSEKKLNYLHQSNCAYLFFIGAMMSTCFNPAITIR